MLQLLKRHWKMFFIMFCYATFDAIVRSTSLIMEYDKRGSPLEAWHPFVWEFSSTFVVFMLVPFMLMFDERYPIASKGWVKRLLIHLPLSMVFSGLHIVGMVGLRKAIYAALGEVYVFTDLNFSLMYEYRKDVMTYATIMFVFYISREIMRLRQGEAQIEKSQEERIMVSKSGVFKFIEPNAVDWVEAAGNYVELHVGDETYMLRATMKQIEMRLGAKDFARVHRSTIVRRDAIRSIKPAMNGDKILYLNDGTELRLSRRYNDNLRLVG
tara:strand:+ start:22645 stop:23451 length:807 start_codon:yes stop_codon:yes gene_type:complete